MEIETLLTEKSRTRCTGSSGGGRVRVETEREAGPGNLPSLGSVSGVLGRFRAKPGLVNPDHNRGLGGGSTGV